MANVGTILPEDIQWVASQWRNRAFELGHSPGAIIVPSEVFARIPVETVVDKLDGRFIISCFNNIGDALKWIKQF